MKTKPVHYLDLTVISIAIHVRRQLHEESNPSQRSAAHTTPAQSNDCSITQTSSLRTISLNMGECLIILRRSCLHTSITVNSSKRRRLV
jgi:hypothetical protein